jgi:hypothetical protein
MVAPVVVDVLRWHDSPAALLQHCVTLSPSEKQRLPMSQQVAAPLRSTKHLCVGTAPPVVQHVALQLTWSVRQHLSWF